MRLAGKNVIVTGAAPGFDRAYAITCTSISLPSSTSSPTRAVGACRTQGQGRSGA